MQPDKRSGIVLAPGEARKYPMGRISTVFKADGDETSDGYSISEWWLEPQGSFVLAPGGVIHDFENRSAARAGVLNFCCPGTFEQDMPDIVEWFADNPPQDAGR